MLPEHRPRIAGNSAEIYDLEGLELAMARMFDPENETESDIETLGSTFEGTSDEESAIVCGASNGKGMMSFSSFEEPEAPEHLHKNLVIGKDESKDRFYRGLQAPISPCIKFSGEPYADRAICWQSCCLPPSRLSLSGDEDTPSNVGLDCATGTSNVGFDCATGTGTGMLPINTNVCFADMSGDGSMVIKREDVVDHDANMTGPGKWPWLKPFPPFKCEPCPPHLRVFDRSGVIYDDKPRYDDWWKRTPSGQTIQYSNTQVYEPDGVRVTEMMSLCDTLGTTFISSSNDGAMDVAIVKDLLEDDEMEFNEQVIKNSESCFENFDACFEDVKNTLEEVVAAVVKQSDCGATTGGDASHGAERVRNTAVRSKECRIL